MFRWRRTAPKARRRRAPQPAADARRFPRSPSCPPPRPRGRAGGGPGEPPPLPRRASLRAVVERACRSDACPRTRLLRPSDFDDGYLQLLSQLTVVGDVRRAQFERRLEEMGRDRSTSWSSRTKTRAARASWLATLVIEHKFIHGGVVGPSKTLSWTRGARPGLGEASIRTLAEASRAAGCCKAILNCSANIGFYERCGFLAKEVSMSMCLPLAETGAPRRRCRTTARGQRRRAEHGAGGFRAPAVGASVPRPGTGSPAAALALAAGKGDRAIFDSLDRDGDGRLTKREVGTVVLRLGSG